MSNPIIRELEEKDLCETSGFFQTLHNLRNEPSPDFLRMERIYRARLRRGVVTDVVVVDNRIVSTISTVFEPKFIHNGGWIAHIEDVATDERYEQQGYATMLLRRAIERARTFIHEDTPELIGCYKIILDCDLKRILWYAGKGFRPHEMCMRLDL